MEAVRVDCLDANQISEHEVIIISSLEQQKEKIEMSNHNPWLNVSKFYSKEQLIIALEFAVRHRHPKDCPQMLTDQQVCYQCGWANSNARKLSDGNTARQSLQAILRALKSIKGDTLFSSMPNKGVLLLEDVLMQGRISQFADTINRDTAPVWLIIWWCIRAKFYR